MDAILLDLIDYCRQPLTRSPKLSLRQLIGLLRGRSQIEGTAIPIEDLRVGANLRPALEQLGPVPLQIAGHALLQPLRNGEPSWQVHDPPSMERLLALAPNLGSLFVLDGSTLGFRDTVDQEQRDEIFREVRAHYRPRVKR